MSEAPETVYLSMYSCRVEYRRADLVDSVSALREAMQEIERLRGEVEVHKQHNIERIAVHADVVDRMALEIEALRDRVESLQNELQLVTLPRDFVRAVRAAERQRARLPEGLAKWLRTMRDDELLQNVLTNHERHVLREVLAWHDSAAVEQGEQ